MSQFCQFCTQTSKKKQCSPREKSSVKHINDLKKFFKAHPYLESYRQYIPPKILNFRQKKHDRFYLICPNVAKAASKHILQGIKDNNNQVIAEVNPGIGYLTKELLDGGVDNLKLYEPNDIFYPVIKLILEDRYSKVEIVENDILDLGKLAYCDSQDEGNRVESLLKDVPNKKWTDDPSMSIIGTMVNLNFIKYLTATMIFQKTIWNKGRMDLYIFTTPANWAVLAQTTNIPIYHRSWMILFNICLKIDLLEVFDRKLFMPWVKEKIVRNIYPYCYDSNNMYFIKIEMKTKFPIDMEDTLPFYVFLKSCVRFTDRQVIPTLEKLVPNCGKNIIAPKQKHQEYFDDINIFTEFKELTPMQTVGIFKELISHPNYQSSPFAGMIESELMTSESISPNFVDGEIDIVTQQLIKKFKF
ncbi:hypothetical protein GWI33_021038 [Rhynchophorus ferrugineus]|uniref:Dimethyladenosine transferase 2, mitochondrial n=1 Tax=Rhynchophorus ferrugineus TaxID=354439 RepID=A0A834LYY7_RHYFE|nr:hypothetical protein GWI33_021038 [Rhynchophorus ferrugineus]